MMLIEGESEGEVLVFRARGKKIHVERQTSSGGDGKNLPAGHQELPFKSHCFVKYYS